MVVRAVTSDVAVMADRITHTRSSQGQSGGSLHCCPLLYRASRVGSGYITGKPKL